MQLNAILNEARRLGYQVDDERVDIHIQDARNLLWQLLQHFTGGRAVWHPEYDQVAAWLTDNKRRGLLMMGPTGVGKTLICTRILPLIINARMGLRVMVHDALELNKNFDKIVRQKLICIDDVGTEATRTFDYGTPHIRFNELLDAAEKQQKLLILNTNLSLTEILHTYGDRADRLRALVTPVTMRSGESHRRQG